MLFVDADDNILFASDYSKIPDGQRILKLQNIEWFESLNDAQLQQKSLNNQVIEHNDTKLLIAEINISPINWRILLINPLQVRQSKLFNHFFIQTLYVVLTIVLLAWTFGFISFLLKHFNQQRIQRDSLTTLPTRQFIYSKFAKFRKKTQHMSLLVMDVDHFKSVNDTYGHTAGDQVLVAVAKAITRELRDDDIAVRWGGEEFVVLLPGCKLEEAAAIARRIKANVANTKVSMENTQLQVTMSIGVSYHTNAEQLKTLFEPADQALYTAKNNGRNRVQLALSGF